MKSYNVTLTRAYRVKVSAKNREVAKKLAEYFVGDGTDESRPVEQKKYRFSISEIELLSNDAIDASEQSTTHAPILDRVFPQLWRRSRM